MKKSKYRFPYGYCIVVLQLSKTHPISICRAISSPHDYNVVVGLVNYIFDETKGGLIGGRKQLHSSRNTIQFKKRLHHFAALFDEITES